MASEGSSTTVLYYEGVTKLKEIASNLDKNSSAEMLNELKEFTDMMDVKLCEADFADALKENLTAEELSSCVTAFMTLTGTMRFKGKEAFEIKDEMGTIDQAIALDRVAWGSLLLERITCAKLSKGMVDDLKIRDSCVEAMEDARSLKYQVLNRFDKDALNAVVADSSKAKELTEVFLHPVQEIPVKISESNWKNGCIPRKMWIKLLERELDSFLSDAPDQTCKLCNTATLSEDEDFGLLDACPHIFCTNCLEKKFTTLEDGFCSVCNRMVIAWVHMSTVRRCKKKPTEDSAV